MISQSVPSRESILVVDDIPANLRLLSQMLSEHGYGVRAVTSGVRALASVQAAPPDLVLLDIRMPEMDGYAVCERLKAEEQARDIPVIFISALGETEDKVRAFEVGGVDYVTKPFQVEEVLARVRTHLALRRLQRQLQEANKKMEQEMILAGEVQASFLPSSPPSLPGWSLSLLLKPARKTSGDFYDIHPLPDGRLGIVIADVVDKGVGAALYMVLCWSLLREGVREFPGQPAHVLASVNRRILRDTHAEEFVTVFYAVLDPATGSLVYCNAGHNPPLLFRAPAGQEVQRLVRTGVPLGILEETAWEEGCAQMAPGDVLVLHTDGIVEAQDVNDALFGEPRLLAAVRSALDPAVERDQLPRHLQGAILDDVQRFVGAAPQVDDITLVILARS